MSKNTIHSNAQRTTTATYNAQPVRVDSEIDGICECTAETGEVLYIPASELENIRVEMAPTRLHPDHSRYIRGLGTTFSGRDTYDIGDRTADICREASTLAELYDVVASHMAPEWEHGASKADLKDLGTAPTAQDIAEHYRAKYSHHNPGMQRMDLGNKLRNLLKRIA